VGRGRKTTRSPPDHGDNAHGQGACGWKRTRRLGRRGVDPGSPTFWITGIEQRDGRPLTVGRKTRAVSPALRRVLQSRDPVCRFPGCLERRYLHAHHIDHWANGGPTDLSNLLRLCSHHHRLLHEGGYTIKRGPRGALRFHRPDGIALPTTLPPISGQLGELQRANTDHGLDLTDRTCRPHVYPDRLDLHWIVDNLAETDGRLSGGGS
jgi:hypothetical protein